MEHIHDHLVSALWPGSEPVLPGEYRDRSLLESAVNRPFQSAFGKDAYPTVLEKGAALFHSLIANHPFSNGNKRTSIIATEDFLVANGYVSFCSNNDIYALARETASHNKRGLDHKESLAEIWKFFRKRVYLFSALRSTGENGAILKEIRVSAMTVAIRVRSDRRNKGVDVA